MCYNYTGIGISLNDIHTKAHILLIIIQVCTVHIDIYRHIRTSGLKANGFLSQWLRCGGRVRGKESPFVDCVCGTNGTKWY